VVLTVACAPAARAPTWAVPTLVVPRKNVTSVAVLAAEPALRTVAFSVIWSVSTGLAGVTDVVVTVRSGFGAGVPNTWTSATWAPGAPVLDVTRSWRSATRADAVIVTVLPDAGSKRWSRAATRLVKPVAFCSRPRTSTFCVRAPQAESGLSLTTTELTSAFDPSWTVSVPGNPLDSQ
jgi:hypothetical protein